MSLTEKIILAALTNPLKNEVDFNILKRQLSRGIPGKRGSPLPTKTELLSAYHKLLKNKNIQPNKNLEKLLTRRAVRTLSGVTIVTSLVKPYPCPGQCVYCPLDERMPKSYLSEEPAAMRALALKFDPYEQMARRIEALENNGHPTDKIELIIKGGTWNSYPLPYQYWFVLESFKACNEFPPRGGLMGGVSPLRGSPLTYLLRRNGLTPPLPPSRGELKLTENSSLADLRDELKQQQRLNEHAKHRIIGLTLETRPDCITPKSMWQMREMGTTRIELGIQHTDNDILKLTKRGHSAEQAKDAAELLRNYGFKTDFHLMPQLPGATPETDLAMLKTIFTDPGYRPDMIKIYPCSVVKGSELYDWFRAGKFKTYPTEDLIRILKEFKTTVPRYCRISRLIRDIPGQYIENGNKVTNLRQVIQAELKKEGRACKCLRCREIGHAANMIHDTYKTIQNLKPKLFVDHYKTHGGTEYFLSFEDTKRQVVFAFCRLRICHPERSEGSSSRQLDSSAPPQNDKQRPFAAYIRELHTYGQLVGIGKHQKELTQHTGLGKKLVHEAERIVKKQKLHKLAVISGVGVRDYYRHLGYRLQKTYMVKNV